MGPYPTQSSSAVARLAVLLLLARGGTASTIASRLSRPRASFSSRALRMPTGAEQQRQRQLQRQRQRQHQHQHHRMAAGGPGPEPPEIKAAGPHKGEAERPPLRAIGTIENPATEDRLMDFARFWQASWQRSDKYRALPYINVILHSLALFAVLFVQPGAAGLAACVISYAVRMFGITAGYHRLFSHKSYKANRVFQFIVAAIGAAAWQQGPLWWAAHHRHHHAHSDTSQDSHSPISGSFWWSHMGWVWATNQNDKTKENLIQDLLKYPELRWLEKRHTWPGIGLILGMLLWKGLAGVLWGFVVPTVLLYHGTYLVNSVCHVQGTRRFQTSDHSRNNPWVALLTHGEGWHNNHHAIQWSCPQGLRWWEIDPTFYVLRFLSLFGITKDLKVPTKEQIEKVKVEMAAKKKVEENETFFATPTPTKTNDLDNKVDSTGKIAT
eukprot:CAMPEP_0114501658 /NCGR_PEP_ID=MMETSP0109-20121206/8613_1 /TAXON_ID=29199 /ORGANISM="Chlorarachnion reptans, Strain CCCM449" /LENGTH=438 /DNA_ID=CAMNT_0001679397 /DNA_START=180 /DNA_END=1494 /DNA_ORIENTATION=+